MRNSPISRIKNNKERDFNESPYQSIIHSRSPARNYDPNPNEDYWRRRAKEL